MSRILPFCVLLCIYSFAAAQQHIVLSRVSHGNTVASAPQSNAARPVQNIHILAVMVDFRTDNEEQTTGDGTFQMQSTAVPMIDPPPHDSIYFQNKVRFVENYFHKVSHGVLTVTGDVFGPITLSQRMSAYSPPTNSSDNRKLAELAAESWHKADSIYSGIDFSRYSAFVIFHAGSGRDIDLVSALGYNPTPFDIPSLFLDSTAFAAALGGFTGIPVDGGSVFIKNTIILPETESRVISTGAGSDSLQYSINGLFAASIGSFLGLPDLFDTKTGRSGIGQFGLMDGAGIFAYNGLFPPEPSAWEKITLGWVQPMTITTSTSILQVPAVGLTSSSTDTIYKIPINQSEYFLLENRSRDPEGNGQWVTTVKNNVDILRHYGSDTAGFNYYDVKNIDGSVVDVENFDWAVIGESDGTGKYDGGGILIWHIDETVIENGMRTNSVNADPEHRGVDLEEADGSQDIGQNYEFLTAGSGTENGSPLDCWFSENSAILYKNVFDRTSFPNSNSFSGAASLVTVKNFSPRSSHMAMSVEIGNSRVTRLPSFSQNLGSRNWGVPTTSSSGVFLTSGQQVYAFTCDGRSKTSDSTGLLSLVGGTNGVAVREPATQSLLVGSQDSTVYIWDAFDSDANGIYDSIHTTRVNLGKRLTGQLSIADLGLVPSILVGGDSIWQIRLDGALMNSRALPAQQISAFTQLPTPSLSKPVDYYFISGQTLFGEASSVALQRSSALWSIAGAVSNDGNYIAILEGNENRLSAYSQDLTRQLFDMVLPSNTTSSLGIADIDGDGSKDIVVLAADKLMVLNRHGVMLDGFPVKVVQQTSFSGTPLIGDIDNDGSAEIVCSTTDGRLWAYHRTGSLAEGFPIQAGMPNTKALAFFKTVASKLGVLVVPESGFVEAIQIQTPYTPSAISWSQSLGTSEHTNADFTVAVIQSPTAEFFPRSRVYNWPNPVYGSSTHIRYYTSEDATVSVTILDLSGVKITELQGRGTAGMDSEILWDVSSIQSGIYLARVAVNSAKRSDIAFIKIAVVK